ncbi:MAG: hypothetical protein ACKOB0_09925, partial [Chthoniobacterales bacterium]
QANWAIADEMDRKTSRNRGVFMTEGIEQKATKATKGFVCHKRQSRCGESLEPESAEIALGQTGDEWREEEDRGQISEIRDRMSEIGGRRRRDSHGVTKSTEG